MGPSGDESKDYSEKRSPTARGASELAHRSGASFNVFDACRKSLLQQQAALAEALLLRRAHHLVHEQHLLRARRRLRAWPRATRAGFGLRLALRLGLGLGLGLLAVRARVSW